MVPSLRLVEVNDRPVRTDRDYVLYWMIANRRTRFNFSLQRAAEIARSLGKPLVVLEALRCDYPWANARLHRFVLEGMVDNAASLARNRGRYDRAWGPERDVYGTIRYMSSANTARKFRVRGYIEKYCREGRPLFVD